MDSGKAFRKVTADGVSDIFDTGMPGQVGVLLGAKLTAAAATATAQLVDADGTVLADLSAAATTSDALNTPVQFRGKVRLAAIAGAGAILNVYIQ